MTRQAAALIVVLLLVVGCGSSAATPSSPAALLAQHDSATESQPYQAALDALNGYCQEDQPKLAAEIDTTYDLEQKDGVHDSRLVTLQALRTAIPDSIRPTRCADILATLSELRKSQQ